MIQIEEIAENEVGSELSKVIGNLRWIRGKLDEPRVDVRAIIGRIDTTLDILKKI